MIIETRFPVRYAETDQMGIVHHSVYPVWFECGRTDFIKYYGISYDELERLGLMLPLTYLTCKYFAPVRYGETVLVKTYLQKATKARLIIGYKVYAGERNVLCAEGTTEHAWTSTDLKPVNIAKYKPDIYQKLLPMYNNTTGENSVI
ncbi:MAG TPA: acyl-CoA thioesterase [Clostridiaceae bacterium]|uniref:acyl-CoA thioesterase n=1 Tax=Thermoclostridium caenicola TaxID=659425 RepID=UPI00198A01A6|nr:thioesterase family protein [Thermoclostridium caenicola]HHW23603.1 acyl-CoA thioesterase [Clostridiaceae bacterium]HPO78111.1 thioesterase family protein [Thermoclostridium caenicola]